MTLARALAPTLLAFALGAAWLGAAAIVVSVVAPAAFAVLPSRTLAGALVGRVLPVLFWSGMLLAVVFIVPAWSLPARGARVGAGIVLFVSCTVAQLLVAPRIARIRSAVAGPIDGLAADDPRRLDFGRLHGISVGLLAIASLAALVAVVALFTYFNRIGNAPRTSRVSVPQPTTVSAHDV
ncbi:MAG: DUF4149 domain-containing protein [bacterium]